MRRALQVFSIALLMSLMAAGLACSSIKAFRKGDAGNLAKAADAPIDVFVGKLTRPYEILATVDSKAYSEKTPEIREKMIEELKRDARKLGADAIQDIRILPIKHRGMIRDRAVPVPGAVKQGYYSTYFMRGEAIKYVEQIGAAPMEPVKAEESTTETLQVPVMPEEKPIPVK